MIRRGLILLIHGLSGCEESPYILASARYFGGSQHPVLKLNLRGLVPNPARIAASPTTQAATRIWRRCWRSLCGRLEAAGGIVPVGYSLGGNMLLKFLACRAGEFPISAAVSVSAPIDLAARQRGSCSHATGFTMPGSCGT